MQENAEICTKKESGKKNKKQIKTLKKYFWVHCMHSYVIVKDKVLKSLKYMYKGDENK